MLPFDEDTFFGGSDGDEVIKVGMELLVLEAWYPVGLSWPGPAWAGPEPCDCDVM
jgi:hypothetical protein